MRVSFHGADQGVTGSCHLLEAAGKKILIDCGMLQGSRELDEENAAPFGFDARSIDVMLLTHAHLDHCGRLPLLVKRGFKGEIIATAATMELARLVVMDAAHLHDEEAQRRAGAPLKQTPPPLYSMIDATNALGQFGRKAGYGEALQITPGIRATFYDAGHILGSASIFLEVQENGTSQTILFSGDIGNAGRPLLRSPQTPKEAQWVVMETTYGDRLHREFSATVEEFLSVVSETMQRGGNIIVPTFALERAQELLFFLREGVEQNRLPPSMAVYLDSPMAVSATEIFEHHPESFNQAIADMMRTHHDPFGIPGLKMARSRVDSMAINDVSSGAVIMAGSGMATGGRIRHHLKHNLANPKAAVMFVGYAAAGTLARQIIDGAKHVDVLGHDVPVRAAIHTLNGFSAHADQRELLQWHAGICGRKGTFLVHGDAAVMAKFAQQLQGERVEMPKPEQAFELS
jgi:metallo-beta-lactamase family protein